MDPPQYWAKTYGGSKSDDANSIWQTTEGSYTIAGYTMSFEAGGDRDFWVLKLNSDGDVTWEKRYGGIGNDHARSIKRTFNGYIVAGYANSLAVSGKADFWVLKLNPNRLIGGECSLGEDSAATVIATDAITQTELPDVNVTNAEINTPSYEILNTDCEVNEQCYYSPPPVGVGGRLIS